MWKRPRRFAESTTRTSRRKYEAKAKMVYFGEALHRVNHCLGVCHYNTSCFDPNLPNLLDPDLAYVADDPEKIGKLR